MKSVLVGMIALFFSVSAMAGTASGVAESCFKQGDKMARALVAGMPGSDPLASLEESGFMHFTEKERYKNQVRDVKRVVYEFYATTKSGVIYEISVFMTSKCQPLKTMILSEGSNEFLESYGFGGYFYGASSSYY